MVRFCWRQCRRFVSSVNGPNAGEKWKGCVIGYTVGSDKLLHLKTSSKSLPLDSILDFLSNSNAEGKEGELRLFSNDSGSIAMVAVSENQSAHSIRSAVARGIRALTSQGIKSIAIDSFGNAQHAAEGAYLSTYLYKPPNDSSACKQLQAGISFANIEQDPEQQFAWERGKVFAESQNFARQLADSPSNYMTPSIFCDVAINALSPFSSSKSSISINVHKKDWILNERMLAFLAVAKGSTQEARFLEIVYGDTSKARPIVLVGKGITFDSGGISIKPSNGMSSMKGDMGGAAAVVASMLGLVSISQQPIQPVVALIPLCENMPAGNAVKPGDVIVARNGMSVEVENTDAEGRLILADALNYAQERYQPECIIDIATLTGAVEVALGATAAGAFSNDDSLIQELGESGERTGEAIWRLPLWDSYLPLLESKVADIRNCTVNSRQAGSCTAAIFLKQFLTKSQDSSKAPSWLHLDIAGVMETQTNSPWYPYLSTSNGNQNSKCNGSMSGFGVRLLLDFMLNHNKTSATN